MADPDFLEQYAATYRFWLGKPAGVTVAPDGGAVYFLRSGPRDFARVLYRVDGKSGKAAVFLTAKELLGRDEGALSAEEKARRERMRLSAKGIARFELSDDGKKLLIPLGGGWYVVDVESRRARHVPDATEAYLAPGGGKLAIVRDGDLYVVDLKTGEEDRLTERAGAHITHGSAEFVAQEEMSRFAGTWWGPEGKRLLYQRTDTTGMETFHLGDPLDPAVKPHPWPYPRPGKKNADVRLFLRALDGEPVEVQWDRQKLPYVSTVRWGKQLLLVVTNRLQTALHILAVDPATGRTRSLHEEQDAAWINLDQSVPRLLQDGRFLWSTERSGEWALEVRQADGKPGKRLTPPGLLYRGLLGVDEKRGHVWVSTGGTHDGFARVSLKDATVVEDGVKNGDVDLVVNDQGTLAVRTIKPEKGAQTWQIVRLVGDGIGEPVAPLQSVSEDPPFEAEPRWLTVQVEDRAHHAVVIRPRNFNPKFSYPVVLSVYGGPGVQVVGRHGERYLFDQWIADHGFVVVRTDGRGTPGRGREWSRAVKDDLVTIPLADQVAVMQALAAQDASLDLARVGVYGWSFGGYLSAMAVMQRPDIFQVGVAGAPVADWRDYDTHYTERFLGLPDGKGKAIYDRSSVLTYAPKLEKPLLIIHGTSDDNVYFVHALKMSNALFRAGKAHEFLPLSGFTHMVSDVNASRALYGRIIGMFTTHLGTPKPRD